MTDQFKVLKDGNVTGSVYRLSAQEPVPLYDSPTAGGNIMRRLTPGSLVVGYSDPGEMRQINTADQVFGYVKRSVTLLPVEGLDPDNLYDPAKRAAMESTLPPLEEMGRAFTEAQNRAKRDQYLFMAGFVMVIVLGILSVLLMHPLMPPAK